jgi:uncharacterized protein YkwD
MDDKVGGTAGNAGQGDGWYYRGKSGRHDFVRGPFSRQQILSLLQAEQIAPDTLIRWGNGPWCRVDECFSETVGRIEAHRRVGRTVVIVLCGLLALGIYVGLRQFAKDTVSIPPRPRTPAPSEAASGPTTGPRPSPGKQAITAEHLVILTNNIRGRNGLSTLEENGLLNLVAQERLMDMLQKQYFGHVSPSGEQASDVAQRVGYRYKFIAENLAYGNFLNDEKVLDGWMQSPGHRKNILAEEPQHIGIAVARGRLKGADAWVAVQIFGLPSLPVTAAAPRTGRNRDASCVPPSAALAGDIEKEKARLAELTNLLIRLSEELKEEKARIGGFSDEPARSADDRNGRSTFIAAHNRKIGKYNEILGQQRAQQSVVNAMVDEYNRGVKTYNDCLRER